MKKKSYNSNFVGNVVILILIVFLVVAIKIIFKPELKTGDDVSIESVPIVTELGIIDCQCDDLYLYDKTSKKLSVYNDEGINLNNYDFSFTGRVEIIEIKEFDKELTVYYYGIQKYYVISFSGKVISIIDDDIGFTDDHLEPKTEVGDYKLVNNVFYYSIQHDEDVLISKMSFMPFILAAVIVFFGGIMVSHKRARQDSLDN